MTVTERRVGKALFREMLGLHFSPRRPEVLPGADQWAEYPAMTLVIHAVELARERGEVYPRAARAEILDNFLATVLRGVESR
jgi:TetR/AcrR family transcriptional repressor of uid operon